MTARWPGNGSVTVHLDGAGQQRWRGHHRLRGHPLHRRRGPGHPDFNSTATSETVDRAGQRHRLHLHRGRHQRAWAPGPASAAVQLGHHTDRARGAHHRHGRRPGERRPRSAGRRRPPTAGRPSPATWSPPTTAGVAQATQTFNSTATTETATGLANGTAYTFTVAAINGVGTGAASAQSNSVPHRPSPAGAHHRDRHPRQRLGHRDLDGTRLQRWLGHHRLRGHPLQPAWPRPPRPSTRRPPPRRRPA